MKKGHQNTTSIICGLIYLTLVSCVPQQTTPTNNNEGEGGNLNGEVITNSNGQTTRIVYTSSRENKHIIPLNVPFIHRISSEFNDCVAEPVLPNGLYFDANYGCRIMGSPTDLGETVHEISYGDDTKNVVYRFIVVDKAANSQTPTPTPTPTPTQIQTQTSQTSTTNPTTLPSQTTTPPTQNNSSGGLNTSPSEPLLQYEKSTYSGSVGSYMIIHPRPLVSFSNANCTANPPLPNDLKIDSQCRIEGISKIPMSRNQQIIYKLNDATYLANFFLEVKSDPLVLNYNDQYEGYSGKSLEISPAFIDPGSFDLQACTISPPPSLGLKFDPTNCTLKGIPTTNFPKRSYEVTMTNTFGQQIKGNFNLTITSPKVITPEIVDEEEFIVLNAPPKSCYYRIQILDPGMSILPPKEFSTKVKKIIERKGITGMRDEPIVCSTEFAEYLDEFPYLCQGKTIRVDIFSLNDVVCNFGAGPIGILKSYVMLSDYRLVDNLVDKVSNKTPLKVAIDGCLVDQKKQCLNKATVDIFKNHISNRSYTFKSSRNGIANLMRLDYHPGTPPGGARGTFEFDQYYRLNMGEKP